MKHIIFNRSDGEVSIVRPAVRCYKALTLGGDPDLIPPGSIARCVKNFVRAGMVADLARKWVNAVAFGGQTDAEANGLIRMRSVPEEAQAVDVLLSADLPRDRWFRDAWGRSHNGGPVAIRMDKARRIQSERIVDAVQKCLDERKREGAVNALLGLELDWPIDIDFKLLRERIMAAQEPEELQGVWPLGIPRYVSEAAAPQARN